MKWIQVGDKQVEVENDVWGDEVVPSEQTLAAKMKECHALAEFYSNKAKEYHSLILKHYYSKGNTK